MNGAEIVRFLVDNMACEDDGMPVTGRDGGMDRMSFESGVWEVAAKVLEMRSAMEQSESCILNYGGRYHLLGPNKKAEWLQMKLDSAPENASVGHEKV